MKKMSFKNRVVALGMAITISASTLFGCGIADYNELRNAYEGAGAAVETQQQETTVDKENLVGIQDVNLGAADGANQSEELDAFNKRLEELEKSLNQLAAENESLQGMVTELEAENGELEATVGTLQQEAVESEAENVKLSETLKRVQELRKQVTREFREFRENAGEFFGFFKDSRGSASAEFDYAYTRSMVEAESGLWYYLIGSANEVEIYDMRSAETQWQPKYAEADFFVAANENFQIVGKNAETGEMGIYQLYAGGGISYVGPTTEKGFEMQKVARIQWQTGGYLQAFASSMSYHENRGEYVFYLTDGYVKPTPKPQAKPQEPEVIVKTETVVETVEVEVEKCFICDKDKANCPGHKETVVETVEVEVEKCFICDKDKANCPGHKETVTKTETVTVEKCFICDKDKANCPGHKETITNTVYQDRYIYVTENKPGHNEEIQDDKDNPGHNEEIQDKPSQDDVSDTKYPDATQNPEDPKNDVNQNDNTTEDDSNNKFPDATQNPEDSKNDANQKHNDKIVDGDSDDDVTKNHNDKVVDDSSENDKYQDATQTPDTSDSGIHSDRP